MIVLIPIDPVNANIAGITMPITAITLPNNIWIAIETAVINAARINIFSGTLLGNTVCAIHVFMPVAPPTRPIATAAVKKISVCTGTPLQLCGVKMPPILGIAIPIAINNVTQPISMPCSVSVIQRIIASVTQTAVRSSLPLIDPIASSFSKISALLTLTSLVGLNINRIITIVMILVTIIGRPITSNHLSQPTGSGSQLAAARGLIDASPVRKIMETGMEAVKTVKPILTASS